MLLIKNVACVYPKLSTGTHLFQLPETSIFNVANVLIVIESTPKQNEPMTTL